MPRARPVPAPVPAAAPEQVSARWPVVRVRVPPDWLTWLDEAARVRAISRAALIRLCIRELMRQRYVPPAGS